VPDVPVSEEFTDAVVRKIRARASRRTVSLATLTRGFFSRESIGVVISMIVLAVLFRTQFTGVLYQLQPLTETQSMQSSAPLFSAEEQAVSEEKQVTFENSSPMIESDGLAKSAPKSVTAAVPTAKADFADQSGQSVLEKVELPEAPAVVAEEISSAQLVIADRTYESLQARSEVASEKSMPSVKQESEQKEFAKAKPVAAKKGVALNESNDFADLSRSEGEPFPFKQFDASVQMGDTMVVTLPSKKLGEFVSAWGRYGGKVIDTVVVKRMVTVRVVR